MNIDHRAPVYFVSETPTPSGLCFSWTSDLPASIDYSKAGPYIGHHFDRHKSDLCIASWLILIMSDSGCTTTPKDKFHCYLRNAIQKIESSVKSAKNIVMGYLQAAERGDFQSARGYLSDNISYVGPLIRLIGLNHTWNILNTWNYQHSTTRRCSRITMMSAFSTS
jgi:hypothetical protein